jgi:secretion/DNA translocation related TadE-like protein
VSPRDDAVFGDEDGSATVAGVGVILGIIAIATFLGLQVTGLVQQHRADAAADLTALSAATVQVSSGVSEACGRAAEIAESNGASLTQCHEVTGGGPDALAGTPGEVGVLVEVTVGSRSAVSVAGP